MASYDVFVAYAGPNAPHARALWEALANDLGKDRVFFDKEQPPGTAIQRIGFGNANAYFLLYGEAFQNLRLFLERILHRLGADAQPHMVLPLPYRQGQILPANVTEWQDRLRSALRQRLGQPAGRLEDLLASVASQQPLFLLIELPWDEDFESPHQKGLRRFLETRLPELMASVGGKGIRLLVAAEYHQRETARHGDIATWMRRAAQGGQVQYEPMAEVQTLSRAEPMLWCFYSGSDSKMAIQHSTASSPATSSASCPSPFCGAASSTTSAFPKKIACNRS